MNKLQTALYYILSFTWGILTTTIGCVCALFMLLIGRKPHRFHNFIYFTIGKNWGGFELGLFFITDSTPSLHTKQHEAGHGIQNAMWGILMPFIISIPSAIRYWIRTAKTQKTKYGLTAIICGVIFAISVVCIALSIVFNIIGLQIFGACLVAYDLCILTWLICCEVPKYNDNQTVNYDSIWFEGNATELGERYFPE